MCTVQRLSGKFIKKICLNSMNFFKKPGAERVIDGMYRLESPFETKVRHMREFVNTKRGAALTILALLGVGGSGGVYAADLGGIRSGEFVGPQIRAALTVVGDEVHDGLRRLIEDSDGTISRENETQTPLVAPVASPAKATPEAVLTLTPPPTATPESKPVPPIERITVTDAQINKYLNDIGGLYIDGAPADAGKIKSIWGQPNEQGKRLVEGSIRSYKIEIIPHPEVDTVQILAYFPLRSSFRFDSVSGQSVVEIDGHSFSFLNTKDTHRALEQLFSHGSGTGVVILNFSNYGGSTVQGDVFVDGGQGLSVFGDMSRGEK